MRFKRFPIYIQHDSNDCGPTCLRMISRYYGKSYTAGGILKGIVIKKQGLSLTDLGRAAERIGYRTVMAKLTLAQLTNQLPLPLIAVFDSSHYVVVYKIKGNVITLGDPSF